MRPKTVQPFSTTMRDDEEFQVRVALTDSGTLRVEPYGHRQGDAWVGSEHTTLDGALQRVRDVIEEARARRRA